ncbi:MAG: hypothetical protein DHS20C11_12870 [Lysobacteraceae bacterium]|nr:MAG: hypothetical protein DHS20C11_12870 [Xanthomonadaceae bacterium]
MIGETLALGSAILWAAAVINFKRSGETMSPFSLNLVKNLIATTLMLPTALLIDGLNFPVLSADQWLLLIASGVVGIGVADQMYFMALNRIGASRTGIAASLFSPSVVMLSVVFLGESLTAWQLSGLVSVVGGIMLISYRSNAREIESASQLRSGILIAGGAVFLMALCIVAIKHIIESQPFMWVVETRLAAGVLGMLLVAALRGRLKQVQAELRAPHHWRRIVIASVFGTYLAMMAFMGGYRYTDASVASVLNETAAMFIMLFAWMFLGETLSPRKISGVCLTFFGVVLMLV